MLTLPADNALFQGLLAANHRLTRGANKDSGFSTHTLA